jgi:DUF4097 and DUF4098 domain-containing protein YvlB
MRRQISFLLITVFALTSLAARAEEWKKDFTTSGKPTVRVESNDAEIRISGWDRKETSARVITEGYRIGKDLQVSERQTGDQVYLEVRTPRSFGLVLSNHSVRIEVSVPREADLNLHTGDGRIRINEVKGDLRLDSGDGDLEIYLADGRLNANTHDGSIRAEGRFDALDLHTGDGNISAEVGGGSKISSAWSLRTGDGNIDLRLPVGLAADLDARSGDGRVNVDLPVTVTGSVRENGIRGKLNGGGLPIEIRTGDGRINVGKS